MLSLAKAFLESPELQAVVVGAVVWLVMFALKRSGVVVADGKDLEKRIGVVALAALGLGLRAYIQWQVHATQPDFGRIIAALLVAWVTATAVHAITKPKPKAEV